MVVSQLGVRSQPHLWTRLGSMPSDLNWPAGGIRDSGGTDGFSARLSRRVIDVRAGAVRERDDARHGDDRGDDDVPGDRVRRPGLVQQPRRQLAAPGLRRRPTPAGSRFRHRRSAGGSGSFRRSARPAGRTACVQHQGQHDRDEHQRVAAVGQDGEVREGDQPGQDRPVRYTCLRPKRSDRCEKSGITASSNVAPTRTAVSTNVLL